MSRPWWQPLFAPRPSRQVRRALTRRAVRLLGVEALEDRATPAVTAALNGTTLPVDLSAAGDEAPIGAAGGPLEVRGGGNAFVFAPPAAAVTAFDINGTTAGNQTVVWNGAVTLVANSTVIGVTTLTVNG